MASQQSGGADAGTSESSSTCGTSSDSLVELNVKTLDSRIYNFRVDKDMPVSSFKQKITDEIGLPVAQQRLIFRGKVLKDECRLSEYHVENGHTLHLVERQPSTLQSSSGPTSGETSANSNSQGNNGGASASQNRIGHISHSVVLGTFNVGDQGENVTSDLTRVIGAVLNSLGINNQSANITVPNASGQAPHVNETAAGDADARSRNQAGNQTQSGQPPSVMPFQLPVAGASIPLPSLNTPIPDSLNTIVEFINRMEDVLSRNGNQPDQSATDMYSHPSMQLPTNAGGLPLPEALTIVLRRAERLLGVSTVGTLSHIAGRLEQESSSTDPSVRSQIQTELVQTGLVVQHLGALFLELGRAILTMRMGQSPQDSVINAGPAVYISPLGPNPIMVQPSLQPSSFATSPLFRSAGNSSANTAPPGPIGIVGSTPRHVNIHIHAGAVPVPVIAARAGIPNGSGGGTQGERNGGTGQGEPASSRGLPMRNVIATSISSRPTVGGVSSAQPVFSFQSPDPASIPPQVAEVNSLIRDLLNSRAGGQQQNSSAGPDGGSVVGANVGTTEVNMSSSQAPMDQSQTQQIGNNQSESKTELPHLTEASPSTSSGEVRVKSENDSKEVSESVEDSRRTDIARDVPLGLGLGGLQPVRRKQQVQNQTNSGSTGSSGALLNQGSDAIAVGQQVLQSLASQRSSSANRSSSESTPSPQGLVHGNPNIPSGADQQASSGQFDMMGMMSQVFQNPSFSSLLSGIGGQTGLGSADDMRSMFQQLSQDPESRNTISEVAQQLSREGLPNLLGGSGRGQAGQLDLSGMIQQMMPMMMPMVSRALSGQGDPFNTMEYQAPQLAIQRSDSSSEQNSQIDVGEVIHRIAQPSSPQDIMQAVVQNSLHLVEEIDQPEGLAEICGDEDLANSFIETLRNDLQRKLQGGSSDSGGES